MTQYPLALADRFRAEIRDLFSRVRGLETRTAAIDSGMPLALLPAVIDPGYTSGDPKAFINGSAVLTGPYNHLAAYSPSAGDTVLAAPVPLQAQNPVTAYVILGHIA